MPGVAAAPNATMASAKSAPTMHARVAIQASWPKVIAAGVSGVAYIAWYRRTQRNPAMTGNVPSNTDPCITDDTSSAGARNWRYGTPPSAVEPPLSTYEPRPTPIASRNRTGEAKLAKIEPRQFRR